MKAKLFSAVVLLFTLTAALRAQDKDKNEPKFKKTKSYTKSYALSSSDKVSLDNQFGEMKLITWEKNEVKVDVSIMGGSDDESRAQQILDRISIQDEKTAGGVSFKTKMGNDDKDWNKNDKNKHVNETMRINYTVYLPASSALNAKNQFGAMIVPDYRGEATLESQFGSLTAGKITNAKNIKVAFGKVNIGQVNNGKVAVEYSSGNINKISGDVDLKVSFSGAVKVNLDNDLKALDIDNSYSTLYLDLSKNLSASYNINTSFGSFKNKSNFTIGESDDRKRDMGGHYSGKSGSGSARISVNSSFGSVIAGHDLQVDTSSKKKTANI